MENQETTTTQEIIQEMENLQEETTNEVAASIDNLTAKITDIQGELHFAFLFIAAFLFAAALCKILKGMIDI